MNDPDNNHADSSAPRVGLTDEVIEAFIAAIRSGDGRRHYVATRPPEASDGESQ